MTKETLCDISADYHWRDYTYPGSVVRAVNTCQIQAEAYSFPKVQCAEMEGS